MKRYAKGFTLIEIAIVLVIIGLLLGGVLKGQELITGARVRNLISQQDGVKAAFFGFQDRYRALPGDYGAAGPNINCPGGCFNGDGNGQIENANAAGTGEAILAWTHLTAAGFMNGSYTMATSATLTPAPGNNPTNPYNSYLKLVYDGVYGTGTITTPLLAVKHNLKTGAQIPVEIVAEVDRKVDDGNPLTGSFQYAEYAGSGTAPTIATCLTTGPPQLWNITGANANCGGASLF